MTETSDTPRSGPEQAVDTHAGRGEDPDVRGISSTDSTQTERLMGDSGPGPATFDADTVAEAHEVVRRYPQARSAVLPLLHLVQSVQGYVSQEGITFCADVLDLSEAEVSAVVTFYSMYKRTPCGQYLVSVCTNTLCAALGGDAIYESLAEHLSDGAPLEHEGTAGTPGVSGSVTLEHAECLAACDLAPVLQVNYEYYDNQTTDSARELVDALRRGERPHPSRGAELSDFTTVERQLAGFFPADERDYDAKVDGPSQAGQTLRGNSLAEERGWAAPMLEDGALPEAQQKEGR